MKKKKLFLKKIKILLILQKKQSLFYIKSDYDLNEKNIIIKADDSTKIVEEIDENEYWLKFNLYIYNIIINVSRWVLIEIG